MEGVGARLGRSSTRYGPTTVFSGPVRKWKKKWVHHISPSSNHHHSNSANNNNASHLLLYKWAPVAPNSNHDSSPSAAEAEAEAEAEDAPPTKKFKYIPIAVLEEERKEEMDEADEEAKPSETDPLEGPPSKSNAADGKPDMNDVPMEEAQTSDKDESVQQDLNETSLDLSLGIKGHDGDGDSDSKLESPSKGQ